MDVSTAHAANACRYERAGRKGHYESYFVRANHPDRPLAFWIRYTIFSPAGRPEDAVGERWAIWFDGETGRHTAAKSVAPFGACHFGSAGLDVRIGEASLGPAGLRGEAQTGTRRLAWDLTFEGPDEPLLLLAPWLYDAPLPKAKSLVPRPLAVFHGEIEVEGERKRIDGWVGSQCHNWGERHTDRYAWGQVAGFDDAPDVFFECATAILRLGPVHTPPLTTAVLALGGERVELTTVRHAVRATGRFEPGSYRLESRGRGVRIRASFTAPTSAFVGLTYPNPPGGSKTCLNTKIAACELSVMREGAQARVFKSARRAAFEILTDDRDHGIDVVV